MLRDRNSRYGTYVNGEQVTERTLAHGDRIRLGRTGGAEMVFLLADSPPPVERATTTAIGDLRQIAALLEGLRALGLRAACWTTCCRWCWIRRSR